MGPQANAQDAQDWFPRVESKPANISAGDPAPASRQRTTTSYNRHRPTPTDAYESCRADRREIASSCSRIRDRTQYGLESARPRWYRLQHIRCYSDVARIGIPALEAARLGRFAHSVRGSIVKVDINVDATLPKIAIGGVDIAGPCEFRNA